MRAITILPGAANSARLDDVEEPTEDDGGILVRTRALGVCGTDHEILSGLYGSAPRGEERLILGHESLGDRRRGATGKRISPRRPCCRHCAPARSRSVSGLRVRGMGYVPQRSLHRARHQGAAWFRRRAFSDRAGLRGEGRNGARSRCRADGARKRRRQGVGACVPDRPALALMGAGQCAGHRRRPDRIAGGFARRAARPRRACARPPQRRAKAETRRAIWAASITRARPHSAKCNSMW